MATVAVVGSPTMTAEDDAVDGPVGHALWERADQVLPGGGVYRTRSADMAGRGVLPGFIAQAQGCRCVDADGRTYIDFLAANGPNLLGYRHREVEAAAEATRAQLTTASMLPPQLVEVVERILATWTDMGWGVVAKNGSEVVTLGVRVARQHTGRTQVVGFTNAYHGNDPELAVGAPEGPLTHITSDVQRIAWNDPQALVNHMATHGDYVAAILLNPLDQRPLVATTAPSQDFLAAIEQARDQFGALLVFDDVRHGLRLHPNGSHHLYGLEPDLVALGKALGNGHAISALMGRNHARRAARKIMFTSTYMFEAPPMAAAMATLDIYERDAVFDHMQRVGQQFCDGIASAATATGHKVVLSGPPTMPTLQFGDDPNHGRVRTFCRHAAENGVLIHPFLNWFISGAHTEADIDLALDALRTAFAATPTA